MKAKTGHQYFIPLAANGNPAILPPNPNRVFLSISGIQAAASLVSFGLENAVANAGDRYQNGMQPLRYKIEEIGDLIQQQLNVWNAGSAGTISIFEGLA